MRLQGCLLPAGVKTYKVPYIKTHFSTCPQILYIEKCIYSRLQSRKRDRNVITWAYATRLWSTEFEGFAYACLWIQSVYRSRFSSILLFTLLSSYFGNEELVFTPPPPLPPDLFFSCPVLSSPQLCDSFCLTIQLRLYWITNFLPPLISKVQGELMFLWVALSLKQSVKKIKRLLFRLLLWLLMARWPLLLRYFLFEGTPTFSCSSAWNQLL